MRIFLFFIFSICVSLSTAFASVNFTATQVCYEIQTTMTGSSSYNDTSIASWNWDLDNDGIYNDGVGKILNYIFPQPDTFLVSLKIVTNSGVADSITKQVIVNPLPQVNFHVDNLCEGQPAIYQDQSTIISGSIIQYNWDFNNDGNPDNNSGPNVSYTCGPAATYVTKLTCVSDKNCSTFATKTTEVFHQPVANFTVQNTCLGDNTSFINTSTVTNETIALNIWDFGDGGISNLPSPQHQYDSTKTYSTNLIVVSQNFCRDTFQTNVTINPPAASAHLEYDSGDSVIYQGDDLNITLVGDNLNNFSWSNGSTGSNITVDQSGVYSVTANDANGCKIEKATTVVVKEVGEVKVTDIVTPNGDGINDNLIIEDIEGYKNCDIKVYNIWNDIVYSSSNYKNDWSGTDKLDAGTYYYVVKCDEQKQKTGNINILK